MRAAGTMKGYRGRGYDRGFSKSSAQYEREWVQKGLMAGSAAATFVAVVFFAMTFPGIAAVIFATLIVLALVTCYLLVLSRDIDFSGDLRK